MHSPPFVIPQGLPLLARFGPWDWGVLALYFALMIVVGLLVGRRHRGDTEEYFLGGRSMPSWALALSFVATALSAATFIGAPNDAYQGDLTYLVLYLGAVIGVVIVALLFVPRLYRAGTVTVYGFLGKRFGQGAVTAVSAAFLFGRMLASGSRLFLAAIPLCLLLFGAEQPTKLELVFAIALIGLIGTAYTVAGGIRAVVWTDTIQITIVVGAALLSAYLLLQRIPLPLADVLSLLGEPGTGVAGHSKLHLVDFSTDPAKPYTLWAAVFGAVFLNVAVYGTDHDFAQRFLISKSVWKGGASLIASQFLAAAVAGLFMFIGLLLYVFYKRPDVMGAMAPGYVPAGNTEPPYVIFILKELPPVFAGLALAGFFAIAQGSMDSAINAMAASAVADLYLPLKRRGAVAGPAGADGAAGAVVPKAAVALMGVLMSLFAAGCAFAYNPQRQSLLAFVLGVMNFAYAGMLGVFLTALFTRRGNTRSVVAALLAGALTVTLLQDGILGWWTGKLFGTPLKLAFPWWMPIGTAVAFAVCVAGKGRPPVARGFPVVVPEHADTPLKV